MAFRPNFNLENPWEGMPANYEGLQTYKPIASNPIPPWATAYLAGQTVGAYQQGQQVVPTLKTAGIGGSQEIYNPGTDLEGWINTLAKGSAIAPVATEAMNLGGTVAGGALAGLAGVGTVAGILSALGMKFPWQTQAGEGFIAPWTDSTFVDDPNSAQDWVQTGNLPVLPGAGVQIVGQWNTRPDKPEYGQTFYKLSDGRLATLKKTGVWKVWRPKKHVVISSNPRVSSIKKLDKIHAKVGKMLSKYQPKVKVRTITPNSKYLSPVERKSLT
jgi:hypothetical protein